MAKNATFKHIDFDSSPVMRSLERLTMEKERLNNSSDGLIVKQAQASISKTADVMPTSNLMENVLKLCARLSEQGLIKQAQELETNFLLYKMAAANTLYDVSQETGEDLVDAAHPDGSHHMENLDADEALFETILDKHKKIVEKIEKKPTGKLANQRAIQAVKKIIAAPYQIEMPPVPSAFGRLLSLLSGAGSTVVGGGTIAASIIGSAIAGGVIGNALFEHYLAPDELKEAGEKLIESGLKVNAKGKLPPKFSEHLSHFQGVFGEIMQSYGAIKAVSDVSKNPSSAGPAMTGFINLYDKINQSNKDAQAMWGFAQSDQDFTSEVKSWADHFETTGLDFIFSERSALVALCKNYMELSSKISTPMFQCINKVDNELAAKTQKETAEKNVPSAQIHQKIDALKDQVRRYETQITAQQSERADAKLLTQWLNNKALPAISKIETDFHSIESSPDKDMPEVIRPFTDKLNQIKEVLDNFGQQKNLR